MTNPDPNNNPGGEGGNVSSPTSNNPDAGPADQMGSLDMYQSNQAEPEVPAEVPAEVPMEAAVEAATVDGGASMSAGSQ